MVYQYQRDGKVMAKPWIVHLKPCQEEQPTVIKHYSGTTVGQYSAIYYVGVTLEYIVDRVISIPIASFL